MTRKITAVLLLCALASCSTVGRASKDGDSAVPITFEVYFAPASGVYDRDTIHILLGAKCFFHQQFDAAKGIPFSLIRERSYRFAQGKIKLPEQGYLKGTGAFRLVIMPDFYQRVGGFRYYLLRLDTDGHVVQVIPEERDGLLRGLLPDRDLFRPCQPGDKIIGQWFF